ncbi:GGDEF domain-containing protein [Paraglaciecola aquimarina]|uniref:diguanylate cyclase n=1 Tax=Paraglaciecola aquimarina TaxID=1235557 RepID=A0ABU3T0R0_9ALTE|nr:GGDEF domain-containing protein [Paraglaciecola aquimarina]MDU0355849.1 GGDEF domain-containing protein [Paraglaciecola aquimarina]
MPLFEALLGQAKAYLALEQIDLAKQKAAESQDILDKMNVPYYEVELSNVYADIAYAKKEYQLGFDILKQNFEFAQELNLKDKEKAVEKYRIQFDSEIKEKENQTLLTENKLKNLRIEQQNSQQELWWLIAGISSLLLIAVVVMLAVQIRNRNHFKSIALKDYLTDSPNRRSILKQAKLYFSETNQTQQSLTVGIIDIDNFKLLNDKYGHDVGDHVLIAFATASKRTLRKDDKFGRYGGEEWLFVFVDTTPEEIHLIFDRLRDEFNRLIQQKQEVYEPVTFSMGAATFDKSIDISLFSLINRADKNLYTAKRLGKDQISF